MSDDYSLYNFGLHNELPIPSGSTNFTNILKGSIIETDSKGNVVREIQVDNVLQAAAGIGKTLGLPENK